MALVTIEAEANRRKCFRPNFCAAVLGGLANDPWSLSVSTDEGTPSRYVYTQPPFGQNGGTNLLVGQAVRVDFAGLLATNQISGYLRDADSHPITNVWVSADATINNANPTPTAETKKKTGNKGEYQ